ncbi:MAG: hypothetical protein R3F56_10760 [Planctomycetota bacterium]
MSSGSSLRLDLQVPSDLGLDAATVFLQAVAATATQCAVGSAIAVTMHR